MYDVSDLTGAVFGDRVNIGDLILRYQREGLPTSDGDGGGPTVDR